MYSSTTWFSVHSTGASAKMGRPRQNMLCMLGKPRSRKFGLESPGLESSGFQRWRAHAKSGLESPGRARRAKSARRATEAAFVRETMHFV